MHCDHILVKNIHRAVFNLNEKIPHIISRISKVEQHKEITELQDRIIKCSQNTFSKLIIELQGFPFGFKMTLWMFAAVMFISAGTSYMLFTNATGNNP